MVLNDFNICLQVENNTTFAFFFNQIRLFYKITKGHTEHLLPVIKQSGTSFEGHKIQLSNPKGAKNKKTKQQKNYSWEKCMQTFHNSPQR